MKRSSLFKMVALLASQVSLILVLNFQPAIARSLACCGVKIEMQGCEGSGGCWQGSCMCGCGCYAGGAYVEASVDCCGW